MFEITSRAFLLLVLGAAGTISGAAQQPGPERHNGLILHSARLLDVKTSTMLSDQVIVIDGDTITAVGPAKSLKTNTDAERIELPNATVLLGLIEWADIVAVDGDLCGMQSHSST